MQIKWSAFPPKCVFSGIMFKQKQTGKYFLKLESPISEQYFPVKMLLSAAHTKAESRMWVIQYCYLTLLEYLDP